MERKTGNMNMFWEVKSKFVLPSNRFWRTLKADKVALAAFCFVILLFLLSVFCFVISPDHTRLANRVCLPIGNQPPGFEVTLLKVAENNPTEVTGYFSKMLFGLPGNDQYIPISSSHYEGNDIVVNEFSASGDSSFESRFNIADVVYHLNTSKAITERNGGLFFETTDGLVLEESVNDIQGIIDGQNLVKKKFLLGTDRMGRDVLSRILVATRATIWTASLTTIIALVLGFIFGMIAILGRRIKGFMLWLIQSVSSVPVMILIAAIMFSIGNGFWHICIVSGIVFSAAIARTTIYSVASAREQGFIETSEALGLTKWHILKKQVLPGIVKPLVISVATVFCGAILLESALGFLGVGVKNPFPSWGAMVRESFGYIIVPGYAYLTLLPGFAIILVSLAFVVLANQVHVTSKENTGQWLV